MRGTAFTDSAGDYRIDLADGTVIAADSTFVDVDDPMTKTHWHTTKLRSGAVLADRFSQGAADGYIYPRRYEPYAAYGPRMGAPSRIRDRPCQVVELIFAGGGWRWHFDQETGFLLRQEHGGDSAWETIDYLDIVPLHGRERPRPFRSELPLRAFVPAGPRPEEVAPDFSVQLSDGRTVTMKDLRGKVVILDFWATWCGPCHLAMPGLNQVAKRYARDELELLGLTWHESGDARAFAKRKGLSYPIGDGTIAAAAYGLDAYGIPLVFIIGRDGRLVDYAAGYAEGHDRWLDSTIERALRR
jgi:thiol-disulfide isomerase/thioredoxin